MTITSIIRYSGFRFCHIFLFLILIKAHAPKTNGMHVWGLVCHKLLLFLSLSLSLTDLGIYLAVFRTDEFVI